MEKWAKEQLVDFLRENTDTFAWKPDDMPGIDLEIITHKLNVNPKVKSIQQKSEKFPREEMR